MSKYEFFKQIPVSTSGIHQYDYFKVAILNRSTKATMTGSFPSRFNQQKVNKNEMDEQITLRTNWSY